MTPKLAKSEQLYLQDKKNIKNIYVHKINSLMKLSRDNLYKQEMEISQNHQKKKIKKVVSEVDKITVKLQKNRESAKKARLRKKLYIKLLESQVQHFKKLQMQGEKLLSQSDSFIRTQQKRLNMQKKTSSSDINLDKYLSNQNLGKVLEIIQNQNKEFQQKINESTKITQQICELTTNTLLKKVCYIKNFQALIPMLLDKSEQQQLKMKEIVKKIIFQNENLKRIFIKLLSTTQAAKQISRETRLQSQENIFQFNSINIEYLTVENFLRKLNINNEIDRDSMQIEQKTLQANINVHQSQKLAIKSQKFLQITNFKSQQYSQRSELQI